jgi:hypothetical protein
MWVADDGSWGAGQVEEFDTSNWTEEDFIQVTEEASDHERLTTAQRINHERNAA